MTCAPTRRQALASAGVLAILAACGKPRPPAPVSAFSGFVDDMAREILQDDPELATVVGVGSEMAGDGFSRRLTDRSAVAVERRRSAALRREAQLRGFVRAELEPDEQLTFDILSESFAAAAAVARFPFGTFDPIDPASIYVLNHLDAAFVRLPRFFDLRQPAGNATEARDYLDRLGGVAAALDAETERARIDVINGIVPPDFIIVRTLRALDGILSVPAAEQPYVTALRRKLAEWAGPLDPTAGAPAASSAANRRARAVVADAERITASQILPAYERAAAFLRALGARAGHDAGVGRFEDGKRYYAAQLRRETSTAMSPDDIRALGLRHVAELTAALDAALRTIGRTEGFAGQRLADLAATPAYLFPDSEEGRAAALAEVRARLEATLARMSGLFGPIPNAPVDVRAAPVGSGQTQRGPRYFATTDASPSVYMLDLSDMSQVSKIDLPTQDYHEAYPGHHLQSTMAREAKDAPLLRRITCFNAYSEGWATYAEQLMEEQGAYENDPIGRLGYLRWRLWRAARLVVDTGLHAFGWTREQAIAYLRETTGDGYARIEAEVDRYAVRPGQACGYDLGRDALSRLRDKAQGALGPRFDLRRFHDIVLRSGEIPLTVLETLVDAYIAEPGGAKKKA